MEFPAVSPNLTPDHPDTIAHAWSTEALFRGLLESAPDAIVIMDEGGRITLVNSQTERLFGYTRAELVGEPVEQLLPERFRGRHVDYRSEYVAAPRTRPMGFGRALAGRRKDGSEFPVEISLSPLQTSKGMLVMSIIRDLTDRLREEERFRGLLEAAPDAMVIINRAGEIVLVNSQTERLFGYPRAELVGQPVEILIPERYQHGHAEKRTAYADDPHVRPMGAGLELYGRRRDGGEVPVEISLSPLQIGEEQLVTAAIRDISDRKATQDMLARQAEELARSNAELEQFAYVASHDLQEPLRMVASYTQLLARRYRGKLDEDADEFIGFAVDGATRMQQLINDLLSYARVSSQAREFEPTDVREVVEWAAANLQTAIEEDGAALVVGTLPTLPADRSQLGQLFQNLIGNALKFRGEAPPQIEVAAEPRDREWRFTVSDNGIGISAENAERVFLIFQRLHSRSEYPGTGIGLALCRRIVERHGGRIWVEPRPGGGTTFAFTLPAQ